MYSKQILLLQRLRRSRYYFHNGIARSRILQIYFKLIEETKNYKSVKKKNSETHIAVNVLQDLQYTIVRISS